MIDAAGNGAPLVLLHGVGANRSIWRDAARELSAERLVLAPDMPGFGESPPAGDRFSLDATADALADAIASRTDEPFDLVGNSLGGAVAVVLACRRPELLSRLVLVAPAGFSPRPWLVAEAAGRVSGPMTSLRRKVGTPLAGSGVARRALLWGSVAAPQRMPARDARTMLQGSRGSSEVGAAIEAVLRCDLSDDLRRSRVPLGLIWGERDRVVPIKGMHKILAARPDAIAETIADAAHVPQIERPTEFVAALRGLLARLQLVASEP